jgi:hypothetical protein
VWQRRTVEPVGLAIDTFGDWPVLDFAPYGAAGIFQQVADTGGAVFLRYGPGQTVDDYVRLLGGSLITPTILGERSVHTAGQPATRVDIALRADSYEAYHSADAADGGVRHETVPARLDHIAVIGFAHRGTPVLVGYRIPERLMNRYRSVLEHVLASVEPSAEPPA